MSKTIRNLDRKLDAARKLTWFSYFLFLVSLWTAGFVGSTPTDPKLLAIISLPLVIFLPGMARESYKSLAMLSFVSIMYFIPLVEYVNRPERDIFDIISLTLVCILFAASMFYSRWAQYHQAGLGAP